jgi:signal transduction histidine kinase
MDVDISSLLFRNVQELLINVIKHSQANKVKVYSRRVNNQIQVSVEDDGVGFDVLELDSKPSRTGGFGLFSIRERLEHIGGRFEIESRPGHGTKVKLTAPLKE